MFIYNSRKINLGARQVLLNPQISNFKHSANRLGSGYFYHKCDNGVEQFVSSFSWYDI